MVHSHYSGEENRSPESNLCPSEKSAVKMFYLALASLEARRKYWMKIESQAVQLRYRLVGI